MRLTKEEISGIKKAFYETFKEGEIYLFGSRIDENQKGGDIDLYIIPFKKIKNLREEKLKFLIKLDEYLGEQKIDVIISTDKNRLIEQEALKKGVKL